MASTIKSLYGVQNTTMSLTLASLGSTSQRASSAVDNSTDLFLDALVFLTLRSNASGTSTTGAARVYAYGSTDGGANYTEGASGTDAAITLTSPPNARLIGLVNMVANGVTYKGGPFSVGAAFGGVLPQKWGIIVENVSGAVFDGSAGNFNVNYQGVQAQSV